MASQIPHFLALPGHLRLVDLGVFLAVDAEARFEQQPVGVRARPLGHVDVAGRRHLNRRRLGRDQRRDAPVVAVLALVVVIHRELVLRSDAPTRHAHRRCS